MKANNPNEIAETVNPGRIAVIRGAVVIGLLAFIPKLAYLAAEFIYNHMLIQYASTPHWTLDSARHLEHMGHVLAAVGGSLIVISATGYALRTSAMNRVRQAAVLAIVSILSLLLLYRAEGFLLQELVDHASAKTRFDAYYLNVLRGLVVRDEAQFPGFINHAPQNFTFDDRLILAELPLAIFDKNGIVRTVETKGRPAVAAFLRSRALHERFERDWNSYHAANTQIRDAWHLYQRIVDNGRGQYAKATQTALSVYGQTLNALQNEYPRYQVANEAYQTVLLPRISGGHAEYLAARLDAISGDYYGHETEYRDLMRLYFDETPKFSYWCGSKCPPSPHQVDLLAHRIYLNKFLAVSGGVMPGLNAGDFLQAESVRSAVARKLRARGVLVANNYNLGFPELVDGVQRGVVAQTREALRKALGKGFPLGLDASEFVSAPGLSRLAGNRHIRNITWMLDQKQFFNQVWSPEIGAEIARSLHVLLPDNPDVFARPEYRLAGDQAVKMLYVIPVALLFSATFGLVNLALLLAAVIALARGGYTRSRYQGLVIAALVLTTPLLVPTGILEGRPVVGHYLRSMGAREPVAAYGVDWLNHGEEFAYRTGGALLHVLPKRVSEDLRKWADR